MCGRSFTIWQSVSLNSVAMWQGFCFYLMSERWQFLRRREACVRKCSTVFSLAGIITNRQSKKMKGKNKERTPKNRKKDNSKIDGSVLMVTEDIFVLRGVSAEGWFGVLCRRDYECSLVLPTAVFALEIILETLGSFSVSRCDTLWHAHADDGRRGSSSQQWKVGMNRNRYCQHKPSAIPISKWNTSWTLAVGSTQERTEKSTNGSKYGNKIELHIKWKVVAPV